MSCERERGHARKGLDVIFAEKEGCDDMCLILFGRLFVLIMIPLRYEFFGQE